jgi:hypothetical protein
VFDLYVPGAPRLEDASRLIWELATDEEGAGRNGEALESYEVLRSAWIGADPLGGDGGWVARTEAPIARLVSRGAEHPPNGEARAGAPREADVLASLRAPRRPHGAWGAIAALGFLGWVGASCGLILKGFDRGGRIVARSAMAWGGLLAAGYAIWIVGLIRA